MPLLKRFKTLEIKNDKEYHPNTVTVKNKLKSMNLPKLRKIGIAHEMLNQKKIVSEIARTLQISPSTVNDYLTSKYDPEESVKLPLSGMRITNREQAKYDIISLRDKKGEYVKL